MGVQGGEAVSIMPIRPIGCRCMAQDDPAWHNKECWIRQTDALRQQLVAVTAERDVLTIIVRDNRMTNLRQELAVAQNAKVKL